MEAADADRQPGGKERTREIDRAWELVGLYPYQTNQRPAAGPGNHPNDLVRANAAVGLIVGVQADLHFRPEHLAPVRVLGEAIEACQRIGRNGGARPLDGITVVVIVRRLDHHEVKKQLLPARRSRCNARRGHRTPRSRYPN